MLACFEEQVQRLFRQIVTNYSGKCFFKKKNEVEVGLVDTAKKKFVKLDLRIATVRL